MAAKPTKNFADANMVGNYLMDRDTVYILDKAVYVDPGETLTIESGTMIKAKLGTGANIAALIVTNGGEINAQGTADAPIIFTSIVDDELAPALGPDDRGLWGGIVLLGSAPVSTGTNNVEGLPVSPRTSYGGNSPSHSSGIMRYVSIRHGGSELAPNNELNGLTMGGVGSGTTISHIEVYANADDGFEWFGGTVNARYLVSAYNDDDAFDWDDGYRGKGQFWFAIQGLKNGNSGMELDGNQVGSDTVNFSQPTVTNITFIGSGNPSSNLANASQPSLMIRDGSAGFIYNSIFGYYRSRAIEIENAGDYLIDSWDRLQRGQLEVKNNIFWDYGAGNTFQAISARSEIGDSLAPYNTLVNPVLRGFGREKNADALDPRPATTSPALTLPRKALADPFFTAANYMGAFSATDRWIDKWTTVDQANITKDYLTISAPSGTYLRASNFDVVFYQFTPGNIAAGTKVTLDGVDVTAAVQPALNAPQPLTGGGKYYRIPNVAASAFGALGTHTVVAKFVLSTGETYESKVVYKLIQ